MPDFFTKLTDAANRNQSLLCVGLDPAPDQIPAVYRQDAQNTAAAILAWNRAVIAQTADLVCAYKPNIAFYEALGATGMEVLRVTLAAIPADIPVILDAKRGDIGSTAAAYAAACFDELKVDAVTLSPYLGRDSIDAFARYADKGLFVLCHTSNPSADDFQALEIAGLRGLDHAPNQPLYLHVARAAGKLVAQRRAGRRRYLPRDGRARARRLRPTPGFWRRASARRVATWRRRWLPGCAPTGWAPSSTPAAASPTPPTIVAPR
jgi:orotidine 5'-phosphate decarboxylase subfamily 2